MQLRSKYIECVQRWEASIRSLRKAIRAAAVAARGGGGGGGMKGRKKKKTTKKTTTKGESIIMLEGGNSCDIEGVGTKDEAGGEDDGMRDETTTTTCTATTTSSWMSTLRDLGNTYNVSKQCETLIHAHDEMLLAQSNYTEAVTVENAAVEEAMAIEKMALDSVQHLEEVSGSKTFITRFWYSLYSLLPTPFGAILSFLGACYFRNQFGRSLPPR